jgi:DNA-binding NtrC family response regulator
MGFANGYIEEEKSRVPGAMTAMAAMASARARPDKARAGETVLLVEDDEEVRFLLYSILKADGYVVLEARDGEHALEVVGAHTGRIHLILTDVRMPRLGGRALVEALLPGHAGMKVMFMSGFSKEEYPDLEAHGVSVRFVQKPFMPKSLLRQIRKALDD